MIRWTLTTALPLITRLQRPLSRIGWYVALTGSVLFDGASFKDLDLMLYPHRGTQRVGMPPSVRRCLVDQGGSVMTSHRRILEIWRQDARLCRDRGDKPPPIDTKWVEAWRFDGKRVDFFVVS